MIKSPAHRGPLCGAKHSRGFTLVEALVAVVITLILILGATQVFLGSRESYRIDVGLSNLQESARLALDFITREVRMAGYIQPGAGDLFPPLISPTDCPGAEEFCSAEGAGGGNDRLALQYVSDWGFDCLRTATGAGVGEPVTNVFRVSNGSLTCQGYLPGTGWLGTAQPLIDGVESFQVLYGEDTDGVADGVVNEYRSADRVQRWDRVLAVRVGLLINSGQDVLATPRDHVTSYVVLDAPAVQFNDRLLRRIFTTTISLRNMRT